MLDSLRRSSTPTPRPGRRASSLRRRTRTRPRLESLERRVLLYHTFVGEGFPDEVWSFTNLSYSYSNLLDGGIQGVSNSDLVSASEEAMGQWAAVTPLTFVEQPD